MFGVPFVIDTETSCHDTSPNAGPQEMMATPAAPRPALKRAAWQAFYEWT
jgi:hypothetical protein